MHKQETIIAHFPDDKYAPCKAFVERYCVRGVVFFENKVAVLKIDDVDDFGKRDYYCLIGGGIEQGETLIEAARRESLEECGAILDNICFHKMISSDLNLIKQRCFQHIFSAKVTDIKEASLDENEKKRVSGIYWIDYRKLREIFINYTTDPKLGVLKHRYMLFILDKVIADLKLPYN